MWNGVIGHDAVVERFRRAVASDRLASTFLFVGPEGIGKRTLALALAKALLCPASGSALIACETCRSCRLAAAGNHPDVLSVSRPEDKTEIPLELLIGPKEKRMREGLCHDLGLKPFLARRRVAVVDDVDLLNQEGANALLKTLEEPPPHTVLILIGTSASRQLPTIRSRSQIVSFQPLAETDLAELLLQLGDAADRDTAASLASLAEGSLTRARDFANAELQQLRRRLLQALAVPILDSVSLARDTLEVINATAKEAPKNQQANLRRQRTRQVLAMVAEYYRALMRQLCGTPASGEPALRDAIDKGAAVWRADVETCAACVERCLAAMEHVGRNAHPATLLEACFDDLARMAISGCPLPMPAAGI